MANIYDMADTWDNISTTFTAIKMNVTDTASASGSLLMDLQVGGASKFKVDAGGKLTVGNDILMPMSIGAGINFNVGSGNYGSIGRGNSPHAITLTTGPDSNYTFEQMGGSNAQTFNLYNIYAASDNYERGFMRWNSNVLEIGTEKGSAGGTLRDINIALTSNGNKLIIGDSANTPTLSVDEDGSLLFRRTNSAGYGISMGTRGGGSGAGLSLGASTTILFSSVNQPDGDSAVDTGLARDSAGVVKVTDGSTGVGDLIAGALEATPTWNDPLTTFTGIKLNVTDTDSDAASLLMDLQVAGTSKFSVAKDGSLEGKSFSSNGDAVAVSTNVDIRSTSSVRWGSFGSASAPKDLILTRDAANTLAQRNGANAQEFRLYNTYTDSSNYERGFMKWNSNVLEIGTEAGGTGSARNLSFFRGGIEKIRITSGFVQFMTSTPAIKGNNSGKIYVLAGNESGASGGSSYINAGSATGTIILGASNADRLAVSNDGSIKIVTDLTVATLPGTPAVGMIARVTDGDSGLTFGNTVVNSGAGATPYLVWYNGTNWTVIGA